MRDHRRLIGGNLPQYVNGVYNSAPHTFFLDKTVATKKCDSHFAFAFISSVLSPLRCPRTSTAAFDSDQLGSNRAQLVHAESHTCFKKSR